MSTGGPTSSSSDNGSNDSSGSSPSTAMIILYSITGIITALFLGIIITGAVRAHRHPERYGPRRIAGRVRQSRARGVARAMLDTIPIVKFGGDPHNDNNNNDDVDAAKGDVELGLDGGGEERESEREASKSTEHVGALETNEVTNSKSNHPSKPTEQINTTDKEVDAGVGQDEDVTAKSGAGNPGTGAGTLSDSPQKTSYYVCPICTDDFVKGQDVRVLPCNHQYHPECVDPWLVNVSGTCPLCRINLNPEQATDTNQRDTNNSNGGGNNTPTDSSTTAPESGGQQRHHRGLGLYLHEALLMRGLVEASPEERIAALRTARRVSRDDNNNNNTSAEERRRRRHGLTSRLRDRFRIRTRQHGESEGE